MGFLGMEIENKIEKQTPDIPKQKLWGKTPDNFGLESKLHIQYDLSYINFAKKKKAVI